MRRNGGRRKAENYQAALEAFMDRNREKIIAVYRDALRANKIAIDQRTAEAIDTQQPDHVVRLQAAERIQDRVYGKPTARTEFTGKLELAALMADTRSRTPTTSPGGRLTLYGPPRRPSGRRERGGGRAGSRPASILSVRGRYDFARGCATTPSSDGSRQAQQATRPRGIPLGPFRSEGSRRVVTHCRRAVCNLFATPPRAERRY